MQFSAFSVQAELAEWHFQAGESSEKRRKNGKAYWLSLAVVHSY